MKVGSLVRCIWQPGSRRGKSPGTFDLMTINIKGELGLIVEELDSDGSRFLISFPHIGYTHPLSCSAFEVLS